jgi:hypothetical protein
MAEREAFCLLAAIAQHVTWSRPITAPSASFQAWITSGIGSSFT